MNSFACLSLNHARSVRNLIPWTKVNFFLSLSGFFIVSLQLRAQDTLKLRSGGVILADVVELSPTEISYRNWKETAPLYKKPLAEVDYVRFANGRLEKFSQDLAANQSLDITLDEEVVPQDPSFLKNKLLLAYNLFDISFPMFTAAFEYTWPEKRVGLMVPFSIGLLPWSFPFLSHSFLLGYNPLFRTGIEPRIYAARSRRTAYILSPAIQYMRVNFLIDYSSSNLSEKIFGQTNIFRFMVYNGFTVVNARHLSFAVELGVGYQIGTPSRTTATLPLNRPAFQLRMFLGRRY